MKLWDSNEMNILIVDDSPTTRKVTIRYLNILGYNSIIEAGDGKEALKILESKPADIIITDWNMPNMNGLEFLKELRADDNLKRTPVLMVTTRGLKEDVISAVKAGANNYIVKPFTQKTLEQKLNMLLALVA